MRPVPAAPAPSSETRPLVPADAPLPELEPVQMSVEPDTYHHVPDLLYSFVAFVIVNVTDSPEDMASLMRL